jgi:hypothetical protein
VVAAGLLAHDANSRATNMALNQTAVLFQDLFSFTVLLLFCISLQIPVVHAQLC